MPVRNTASALGEAIGKLIEDEIERILQPICQQHNYTYDRGGLRPDKRKGKTLFMVNASGNKYQLDGVIENPDGKPVVLLESKYLRYKKHNRDKGSWTCASHYSLRKTYPTIRKSIAVLSGRWSEPSKAFMQSFGIELYHVDFPLMCSVMRDIGIDFDWPEDDREIPDRSWQTYLSLSEIDRQNIAHKLLESIREALASSVQTTLESGEDWPQHLTEIELLLKTDRNEYFTHVFHSAREALDYLLSLHDEVSDLRGRLRGQNKPSE